MLLGYRNYYFSTKATLVSGLFSLIASLLFLGGGLLFCMALTDEIETVFVVPGAILAIGAIVLNLTFSRKITDKIASNDIDKKLHTNAKFCAEYVNRNNMDKYEAVCAINEEFKNNYIFNAKNKLIHKDSKEAKKMADAE